MRTHLIVGALMLVGALARAEGVEPPGTVEDLDDLSRIGEVCLGARATSRAYFGGDAAERTKAVAEFKAKRHALVNQLYRLRVAQDGFTLGDYSRRHEERVLDLSTPMRALHGAVSLAFPDDGEVKIPLTDAQADLLAASLNRRTVSLVAYFQLDDDARAVCSGSVGAQLFRIEALPVAFELRGSDGQVIARGDTSRADRFRAFIGGYRGTPTATFGAVEAEGTDPVELSHHLPAADEPLKKCYAERLKARNDAGGTLVVGVSVDAAGAVDAVTFIADALDDEPLRKCVDEEVRHLSFVGVPGLPALFRVPVHFRLVAQR